MFSLIYDIATSNNITFVPVVSIISRPNRCRIVFRSRNSLTICNLGVTTGAIRIAGITFFIARGFFLSYKVCTPNVVLIVKITIGSFANGTNCLIFTSSSATAMVGLIELSSARASVEVLCSVALPFAVCINVVASCGDSLTICNLSFAVLTPSVASISCFVTAFNCRITDFSIYVFCTIKRAISNITHRTYCLCRAGSSSTAVFSLIYDIATSNNITFVPVVSIISRPNRCRTMIRFRNGLSICNLCVTAGAICITGITFLIARGLFLSYKVCAANVVFII